MGKEQKFHQMSLAKFNPSNNEGAGMARSPSTGPNPTEKIDKRPLTNSDIILRSTSITIRIEKVIMSYLVIYHGSNQRNSLELNSPRPIGAPWMPELLNLHSTKSFQKYFLDKACITIPTLQL